MQNYHIYVINIMLTEKDLKQIAERGISEKQVEAQLKQIAEGFPFLKLEAAASTGGQLMPPIMGAAAFLMAESLGLPYITIVKASIIPALLYFAGIFITVHLEAHKLGLKGLPREQLPKILPLLLKKGYMILPLVIIVVYLCMGRTAVYAAFMGIACCMLIGLITSIVDVLAGRQASFGVKDLLEVTTAAARNIISVAIACAMAGIIIGIVALCMTIDIMKED